MLFIVCLLPMSMQGQRIVSVNVDSMACIDNEVLIGFGFNAGHEIVVANQQTSLSHPDQAFLPDAIPCGDLGCSYRSTVTFNNFADGAQISSVNDINYVRINMEHSFLGDLYINITCPNGQKADILKFSNYSNNPSLLSACLDDIPASSKGWSTPSSSNNLYAYLGMPNTTDNNSDPCNTEYNAPGPGWNYCWSNNNAYSYAGNNGYVYRSSNQTFISGNYRRVDSSNVAAGSNFYHPDQSFASLVGCPLNGEWYIEVIDGVRQDNGYIFDWELALNPALISGGGQVAGYDLIGDSVRRVDDSTFLVMVPEDVTSDTTLSFTAKVLNNIGTSIDTVVSIHFFSKTVRSFSGYYCEGDTVRIDSLIITTTTQRIDTSYSATNPCPNIRVIDVVFDSGWRANPLIAEDSIWMSDTMLAGCIPYTVRFTDTLAASAATLSWHLGDTGWIDQRLITHTYDSAGVYTVTLATATLNGCRDTAIMKQVVWVFDIPVADFAWAPENPVMSHPEVELFAIDSLGWTPDYIWTVQSLGGGVDTLTGTTPRYSWGAEGEYPQGDFEVIQTAILSHIGPYGDTLRCYDSVARTITIINDWLQFPNLVSPNGDGVNDRWEIVNLLECGEYSINELWIYSAWGVPVYHVRDIDKAEDFWDPEETRSPDGTYYYRFLGQSAYGIVKRNGVIEVVR